MSSMTIWISGSFTMSRQSGCRRLGQADALGFLLVAAACAFDNQVDSVVLEVFVVVFQDETGDAAADGAEADEAEVHALHTLYSFDMH